MKKLLKSVTVCILGLLAATVSAYAMPDIQTMYGPHYITDDDFGMIMSYENTPIISGWDVDSSGGTFMSSRGEGYFLIEDTSDQAPVSMSKKLRKTENCIVTVETSFSFSNSSKNSYFRLSSGQGQEDVFRLSVSGGKLWVDTKNGVEEILSFKLNIDYGIKLRIDLKNQKYDIWADGAYMGNYEFCNNTNSIDFVEVSTGVKEKARFFMDGLKIHTGFALNEQFFAHTDGKISEDWSTHTGSGASVKTELNRSAGWPDYYSARLQDLSSVDYASIERKFEMLDKHAGLEAKFCVEDDNQEFALAWKNDDKNVFLFESRENALFLNGEKIYDYVKNVWYILSIEADFNTKKANIYINNRILCENVSFMGNAVNGFTAKTSMIKHTDFLVDDILAYEINEPENYVPEPKQIESKDIKLGIQTCDMWRNGTHLGWDYANADPNRRPYLGFYDEGSREAADWEIKYMVETGLDFRATCWFIPGGYHQDPGPLKMGSFSHGLLEGFMRAKYSDKMNYAIIWENSSSSFDHNVFKNYLVPYWIEYFIKDPRYLVVDNKPVFYLYLADTFYKNQGNKDLGLASECLNYLRDECRKLGYDGCTIIASTSGNSEEYASLIGCDGLYSYVFSATEMSAGAQPKKLTAFKERNEIFVQPTICQGFDSSAWLNEKGTYSTIETFRENSIFVRDEFFKNYKNYTLSEKLAMVATWNEYCEGHYVAPCGLAGFGYLDTLRDVFTDCTDYKPELPTEEEKRNYCILFPENREPGMRGEPSSVPIPETVVKKWEGEDFKKWKALQNIENYKYENGIISGDALNVDPAVMSEEELNIPASGITYVRVRMNQISTAKQTTLYYIREDDTKWNDKKGLTITPENAQDGFYDVYYPVWQRGAWRGTIKQIRIDPLNSMGSFAIEKVEFLKGNPGDILFIELDGNLIPMVEETKSGSKAADYVPSFIDGTFYMPPSCYSRYFGLKFVYDSAERKYKVASDRAFLEISVDTGEITVNGKSVGVAKLKEHKGLILIPLRSALEPLGYTIGWDADAYTAIVTSPPPMETNATSRTFGIWNFNEDDNMDGWEPNKNVSQASVMGGTLRVTSSTADPSLYLRNINIDATKYKVLRLRMKNSTSSKIAELFFTTSADATLNEAKKFKIAIEPNSDFVEYEIDLENALWKGNITQLRFDPIAEIGNLEIDYLTLSEK